jgi:hypothetical protein
LTDTNTEESVDTLSGSFYLTQDIY